jgi:hypothetical protein
LLLVLGITLAAASALAAAVALGVPAAEPGLLPAAPAFAVRFTADPDFAVRLTAFGVPAVEPAFVGVPGPVRGLVTELPATFFPAKGRSTDEVW